MVKKTVTTFFMCIVFTSANGMETKYEMPYKSSDPIPIPILRSRVSTLRSAHRNIGVIEEQGEGRILKKLSKDAEEEEFGNPMGTWRVIKKIFARSKSMSALPDTSYDSE